MINKKGQVLFYGLMLGLTILVLALALAPSVSEFTIDARNVTDGDNIGMNCSTTNDNFIKATCTVIDLNLFYFIGALLFIGGGIISAKIIFS